MAIYSFLYENKDREVMAALCWDCESESEAVEVGNSLLKKSQMSGVRSMKISRGAIAVSDYVIRILK
jgi:hypothetical protein